jgi:UDP-N-acetylmuramate--alanine ligase
VTQKTIHFIGIGGIGMSGIARVYLSQGFSVQGSDLKKTAILSDLESLGARIFIGHDASHVMGADCVVYSSSIAESHMERRAAQEKKIPVIHRAQALADLCRDRFTIAVTGTHGKTTTTALIGMVLKEAQRDPMIVVGGLVSFFGGNACHGGGPEVVIEADESDSSFLRFSPALEVITNIEEEHMDHFHSIENIEMTYRNFVERLPGTGLWFGCAEDRRVMALAKENRRRVRLYGLTAQAQIRATDIVECPGGRRGVNFKVWNQNQELGTIEMSIIGVHNVLNTLAAVGVGLELGIPFEVIVRGLQKFQGAARRFDVKYEDGQYLVADDYAHHPTEIQKTLKAARGLGRKRILAVFQPHRYTRTKSFLPDFAKSFSEADALIVTDIYAASEEPIAGVTGRGVAAEISKTGHPSVMFCERSNVTEMVRKTMRPGDLVIVLGAGDIYHVADEVARGF